MYDRVREIIKVGGDQRLFICMKGSGRLMKAYLTDMGLLCVQATERV